MTQTSKKILDACEDVRKSLRLKKVLKTILKVGNQMNDGDDNLGFSLDTLLKLQQGLYTYMYMYTLFMFFVFSIVFIVLNFIIFD